MKHNWEYKKLGDICSIVGRIGFRGYTRDDLIEKGNGAISLSPSNIIDGKLNFDDKVSYLSWEKYYESPEIMLAEGDVVFTKTASIGKCALVKKLPVETTLNPQLVVLKNIQCDSSYLTYTLQDKRFQEAVLSKKGGTSIPTISQAFLGSLPVPVPPIETQKQIVAELDKINETIEDCRELLRNLDALKLSLFYDYFGDPNTNPKNWNISTFGEIGTFIRGGGFLKRDFVDFGIPCIHYGQIHTKFGEVVRKNLTYISEYTALKSKFAKPNDVILAITSEDLEGSCKSVAWLGDFEVAVGGHAAIFTHNQNPVFISFYTRSNAFCIEKEKYAHGSKVVEIRPKDIEKIPIYLPPLELQEKFAERIEQIEEQKKTVESTIAELQTLLDSRMDYWFN